MSARHIHRAVVVTVGNVLLGLCVPELCRAQPFQHPASVAVDSAGYVYVSEPEKHRIQKFDANGVFITQWGGFGSANGQFNSPRGIAVDLTANVVYVADSGNSRIQKFTTAGAFVAKWGTYGNLPAQFRSPTAIAVDAAGSVYVADAVLKRIQIFTSAGTLVTSWGGQTGTGDGQFSPFSGLGGIAISAAGNVYISDTGNHRIMTFTPTGGFLGWAGRCTSGVNCDTVSQRSRGLTCTAATCAVTPQPSVGSGGTGDGQFILPGQLVLAPNGLYVADTTNDRIQILDASGFKAKWGTRGVAPGEFRQPLGVAVTSTTVYVADTGNNRIQKFDLKGALLMAWGADVRLNASPGEAPGFVNPITVQPSSSEGSMITVTSLNQYAGPIDLRVSCCLDWDTSLGITPPGVFVQLSTSQVTLASNGSATAVLDLSASQASRSGKYVARVTAANPTAGIQREIGVVFTVAPAPGADISLAASPADPPGLGDLTPPKSATATITVGSVNGFQGRVVLAAPCCFDVIDQKQTLVPGVTVQPSAQTLDLLPNASQTVTMTVTTAGTPTFGKFLVPVTVKHEASGIAHEARIAFTVIPQTVTPSSCRSSSIVTTSMRVPLELLIEAKERVPPLELVRIAWYHRPPPPGPDTWRFTITVMEDPGLSPSESIVVLENRTSWPKEITTSGCSMVARTVRVDGGKDGQIQLVKGADRTIVFRKPFCTGRFLGFLWCNSTTWGDVDVLEEPGFWRVFGGRTVTFTWLRD